MTTPDPTSLAAILEPTAADRNYHYGAGTEMILASQAVSLKRIADALDKLERHLAPTVTAAPQPYTDGWIQHDGGPCPVNPDQCVDTRFRDGDLDYDTRAGHWAMGRNDNWWLWQGRAERITDIIAYRLHKDTKPE